MERSFASRRPPSPLAGDWLAGRVVENRRWGDQTFTLRVAAGRIEFEAGQFTRLALDVAGSRIARPFSFANPPDDPVLEFLGAVVPDGALSPRLARLQAGDELLVASRAWGGLVLSRVPEAESLWLIATGTGVAPFLSMLATPAPWIRFREVVLVHGTRLAADTSHAERVQELVRTRGLRWVRCLTGESRHDALAGRLTSAVGDGRLERAAGVRLERGSSKVLLCGNPSMIAEARALLAERGLREGRRDEPGDVFSERFW